MHTVWHARYGVAIKKPPKGPVSYRSSDHSRGDAAECAAAHQPNYVEVANIGVDVGPRTASRKHCVGGVVNTAVVRTECMICIVIIHGDYILF